MKTKTEIESTRFGGLGGSDAAMVYKVGLKGIESLSNTDKKRLAVMTGQIPYQPTPSTPAMEAGHKFEDVIATMGDYKYYDRERKIEGTHGKNFEIFAHADFSTQTGVIVECKFSQKTTEEVLNAYKAQLQWYYLLGAKKVILLHGCGQVEPFEITEINTVDVDFEPKIYEIIVNGLKLIDDFIDTFQYTEPDEWDETDLLPFDRLEIEQMRETLQTIKRLEFEAEEAKKRVLQLFRDNGIKSLKSDSYSITYVPESTTSTLDKSRLFKEHPEISESNYLKTSKKSDYVKITLK